MHFACRCFQSSYFVKVSLCFFTNMLLKPIYSTPRTFSTTSRTDSCLSKNKFLPPRYLYCTALLESPATISRANTMQILAGGAFQAHNSSNPELGSMLLTEARLLGDAHSSQRYKPLIDVQKNLLVSK